MTEVLQRWGFAVAPPPACALLAALVLACSAHAAVPNEDAHPAYAEEQTILQQEKDTPEPGWTSLKSGREHMDRHYLTPQGRNDAEQDLILQRGGNTWRWSRNGWISTTSAAILVLALLVLAAIYKFMGPSLPDEPLTGRKIARFSRAQRIVHWTTAIAFLLLAATGLVMFFGKKLLLPWMGHTLFSWIAIVGKYLHNIAGPLFVLFSLVMFLSFVQHNYFGREDWHWLRHAGRKLEGGGHARAGYFNAGEKLWFWFGVVALGLLMGVTGFILDFTNLRWTRYLLQWADWLHVAGATFYIAMALGHIYLGTLGTPGAYEAMRHGTVDEAWARSHHRAWYDEVAARERLRPRRAQEAP